jgi:hypothetical protein
VSRRHSGKCPGDTGESVRETLWKVSLWTLYVEIMCPSQVLAHACEGSGPAATPPGAAMTNEKEKAKRKSKDRRIIREAR